MSNVQRLSKRTKMVRELITEVVGFAPYEKRMMDMLKTGGTGAEKRVYKFAKRRVRTVLFLQFFHFQFNIFFSTIVGNTQTRIKEEGNG